MPQIRDNNCLVVCIVVHIVLGCCSCLFRSYIDGGSVVPRPELVADTRSFQQRPSTRRILLYPSCTVQQPHTSGISLTLNIEVSRSFDMVSLSVSTSFSSLHSSPSQRSLNLSIPSPSRSFSSASASASSSRVSLGQYDEGVWDTGELSVYV